MKKLLALLFSFSAMAQVPWHWAPETPDARYPSKEDCPTKCYPLLVNGKYIEPSVSDIAGDILVEDPVRRAQFDAAQKAKQDAKDAKKAQFEAAKAKLKTGGISKEETELLLRNLLGVE